MWYRQPEVAQEPCLRQVHLRHQVEVQPRCRLQEVVLQLRLPEMDQLCRRPQWEDRCPLDLLQGMGPCVEDRPVLDFHPQHLCLGVLLQRHQLHHLL